MNREIVSSLVLLIFCAGCGGAPTPIQATDVFSTATLPPTVTPQTKPSPTLPAATQRQENIPLIEGIVTTQLNVRAEPSTAGEALGTLEIFSKVKVLGKTPGGGWYQILYEAAEGGTGWARSEYVQVEAGDTIQVVALKPETASGIGGVIVQKVNVRKEARTDSELLGTLSPQDFVFITGRNANGTWLQIEFTAAPSGRGWVAAEFVQTEKVEDLPQIGEKRETPPPSSASLAPTALEGDSPQSPLAAVFFSPAAARAAQWDGSLSTEDSEDWFRFSAAYEVVLSVEARCAAGELRAELWKGQKVVKDFSCGNKALFPLQAEKEYLLRLTQNNEEGFTVYKIFMEVFP